MTRSREERLRKDETLVRAFQALTFVGLLAVVVRPLILRDWDLLSFISSLLGLFGLIFFILGIPFFVHYRTRGIMRGKRVLTGFVLLSLLFTLTGVLVPCAEVLQGALPYAVDLERVHLLILALPLVFAATLAALFSIMIHCFGVIGVVSAYQRMGIPWLLCEVKTLNLAPDSALKKSIRWIFAIPGIIDTHDLSIDPYEEYHEVRWPEVMKALKWNVFFSTIFVIYFSLNPIFLEITSIRDLLIILSQASILIPAIILFWFIYQRLDARIRAPLGYYHLFDGMKSRILQFSLTIGVIVVYVKLALETASFQTLLLPFLSFYLGFILIAAIFTFAYFNYFENDLARDITDEYLRLQEQGLKTAPGEK
jgi:hypothetical protein